MIFGMRKRIPVLGVLVALLLVVAACGDDDATGTTLTTGATKVASVAGGPHPFFDPWGPGTADAVAAFDLAGGTYQFPPQWELTAQNNLVETLVAQGYNAFIIFPGDANGTNALMEELQAQGIPSIAGWRLHERALAGRVLPGHRRRQLGLHRHQGADRGHGRHLHRCRSLQIVHIASRLVDPNTQARIAAVDRAVCRDRTAPSRSCST